MSITAFHGWKFHGTAAITKTGLFQASHRRRQQSAEPLPDRDRSHRRARRAPDPFRQVPIQELIYAIPRKLPQVHVLEHADAAEEQLVMHVAQLRPGRWLDRHA